MEILLNPDGSRSRIGRPYISQEEYHLNVNLYDPEGPGPAYGLYTHSGQPQAQRWVDHAWQYRSQGVTPIATIDRFGLTARYGIYGRSPVWQR